ncbi:hypothetical protein CDAR_419181 [Caerostris darwini]|uniref:Uncharacterized protein n=1 Tax=Caerostris darwini TaxID=1538125 RepID=A0AAV4MVN8_9ARAC|nr:hypothetical protein CDAR_419181 [Caerostris darwini]
MMTSGTWFYKTFNHETFDCGLPHTVGHVCPGEIVHSAMVGGTILFSHRGRVRCVFRRRTCRPVQKKERPGSVRERFRSVWGVPERCTRRTLRKGTGTTTTLSPPGVPTFRIIRQITKYSSSLRHRFMGKDYLDILSKPILHHEILSRTVVRRAGRGCSPASCAPRLP